MTGKPDRPSPPAQSGPDSKSGDVMRANLERHLVEAGSGEVECVPPPAPDHELLHRIGGGAYGDVWLARNALGALRAVKVVYRARFRDDRPYEREFHGILKYEPISRTHEGLVQVLHVGRDEARGCFYYVMELADDVEQGGKWESGKVGDGGATSLPPAHFPTFSPADYSPRTLRSDLARQQRLAPAEAAQFVLRLAAALGHLHAHGLVHRDIKPSNVIFVGGQPKLADIGLVTDVGSSQSFVGTEGFIPPEGPGTPQADLYGLGKLLYELATGRDRMDFPQLPPGVTRLPDGEALLELNEVMTRACAPQPQQRHASATELQAELNLFLAGRSLRRVRNVERHLARLKKLAAAACGFLALAAVFIWFVKNEERHANQRAHLATERARAESTLRLRAENAEHATQQQLYTALLEQARATVRSGELGQRVRTLDAVRRAATISNTVELRREAFAALALPDLRFEHSLPLEPDVTAAALDPGFERLAVGRGSHAVEIRSVPDQRVLAALLGDRSDEPAHLLRWSADGRFLGVLRHARGRDARPDVEFWDVGRAQRVVSLSGSPWGAFSFHPTLPRALCADAENAVKLWNLETGREIDRFTVTGLVHHVEYTPDGEHFLAQHRVGRPWFTTLHDTASGTIRKTVLTGWIDGLAWDAAGRWLALATRNGEVHLHDRHADETIVLGRHKNEARTAVFSPDGRFLFTGGEEQEIICWDVRLRQRAFTIGLQSMSMQLRADGGQCAVLNRSGVLLHTLEQSRSCRELTGDLGGSLRHAAISPDGRWLAAGGMLRLGVWNLKADTPAVFTTAAEYAIPFFAPDGSELFAYWAEGFARWSVRPGVDVTSPPRLASRPVPETRRVHSGQFVSDLLVLGTQNGVLAMPARDVASSPPRRLTRESIGGEVSPNGQWLAVRFRKLWEVRELNTWKHLAGKSVSAELVAHAFTPAGDELVFASMAGLTFLSTNDWKPRRHFAVPLDHHAQLHFAPDGRTFWLTRDARTAALHDTRTFETLLQLPNGMTPLALGADGRHLAVSVDRHRVQVWDLAEARRQMRALGLDWAERP